MDITSRCGVAHIENILRVCGNELPEHAARGVVFCHYERAVGFFRHVKFRGVFPFQVYDASVRVGLRIGIGRRLWRFGVGKSDFRQAEEAAEVRRACGHGERERQRAGGGSGHSARGGPNLMHIALRAYACCDVDVGERGEIGGRPVGVDLLAHVELTGFAVVVVLVSAAAVEGVDIQPDAVEGKVGGQSAEREGEHDGRRGVAVGVGAEDARRDVGARGLHVVGEGKRARGSADGVSCEVAHAHGHRCAVCTSAVEGHAQPRRRLCPQRGSECQQQAA